MKKDYLKTMTEYAEAEKKPVTDFEKFVPQKPGRKQNLHEHYFTGEDEDKDPNEKNSILSGKGDSEDRTKWNKEQQKKKKEDNSLVKNTAPPPFADIPDALMTTMSKKDKPGLWDNINKKKEREGKNYKPAKPGDPDRPDPEAFKKAQS
jgi:hypothetical protein